MRVSYLGSTMRKLLVHRDDNTVQASAVPLGDVNDGSRGAGAAAVPDLRHVHGHHRESPARGSSTRCSWSCSAASGAASRSTRRTRWPDSDSNAPDSGNSTIGVVQYDPYDIEKDRGPDPNVVKHRFVMNSTWDIPVGRERTFGGDLPRWADAIVGGWTVSTIFQARSGPNLTPYFTYGDTDGIYPGQHRAHAGRRRTVRRGVAARRHRRIRTPAAPATRFFDLTAFTLPAPGTLGNAKKGSVQGPGTWIVNFAFYKDIVRDARLHARSSPRCSTTPSIIRSSSSVWAPAASWI